MAKKENENRVVVEVKIEGKKWTEANDKAFNKAVKNVTVDGFRGR